MMLLQAGKQRSGAVERRTDDDQEMGSASRLRRGTHHRNSRAHRKGLQAHNLKYGSGLENRGPL